MRRWLGGGGAPDPDEQNQVQSLRLELDERTRQLDSLRRELEQLRYQSTRASEEAVQDRLQELVKDLATPAAQLVVQDSLLEQGVEVKSRDVMAVSRRLLESLQRAGMTLEGEPGQEERYDPNHHQPLSLDVVLKADQAVRVRFPGVSMGGRLLKKALVEPL